MQPAIARPSPRLFSVSVRYARLIFNPPPPSTLLPLARAKMHPRIRPFVRSEIHARASDPHPNKFDKDHPTGYSRRSGTISRSGNTD